MFLDLSDTSFVEDKIGSVLGLGRSGKDCFVVIFQDLQPDIDVFRMAHRLEWNGSVCAQESGTNLGDQFLERIVQYTEAVMWKLFQ